MATKNVPVHFCNHCGEVLRKPDAAYFTVHHVSDMPGSKHGVSVVFKGQRVPLGETDTRTDYCSAACLQAALVPLDAAPADNAGTTPADGSVV